MNTNNTQNASSKAAKVIIAIVLAMVSTIVSAEGVLDRHPGLKYNNYNEPTLFYDDEAGLITVETENLKSYIEGLLALNPYADTATVNIHQEYNSITGTYYDNIEVSVQLALRSEGDVNMSLDEMLTMIEKNRSEIEKTIGRLSFTEEKNNRIRIFTTIYENFTTYFENCNCWIYLSDNHYEIIARRGFTYIPGMQKTCNKYLFKSCDYYNNNRITFDTPNREQIREEVHKNLNHFHTEDFIMTECINVFDYIISLFE